LRPSTGSAEKAGIRIRGTYSESGKGDRGRKAQNQETSSHLLRPDHHFISAEIAAMLLIGNDLRRNLLSFAKMHM
jgi:hypothetical protein